MSNFSNFFDRMPTTGQVGEIWAGGLEVAEVSKISEGGTEDAKFIGRFKLSPHQCPYTSMRQSVDFTVSQYSLIQTGMHYLTKAIPSLENSVLGRIGTFALRHYLLYWANGVGHETGHSLFGNLINSRMNGYSRDHISRVHTYGFDNWILLWPTSGYMSVGSGDPEPSRLSIEERRHIVVVNDILRSTAGWVHENLLDATLREILAEQKGKVHHSYYTAMALNWFGRITYVMADVISPSPLADSDYLEGGIGKFGGMRTGLDVVSGGNVKPASKGLLLGQMGLAMALDSYFYLGFYHLYNYIVNGVKYVEPFMIRKGDIAFSPPGLMLVHKRNGFFYKFDTHIRDQKSGVGLSFSFGMPINFANYQEKRIEPYSTSVGYPVPDTVFGMWAKLKLPHPLGDRAYLPHSAAVYGGVSVNHKDKGYDDVGGVAGLSLQWQPFLKTAKNPVLKGLFMNFDMRYSRDDLVEQHIYLEKPGLELRGTLGLNLYLK